MYRYINEHVLYRYINVHVHSCCNMFSFVFASKGKAQIDWSRTVDNLHFDALARVVDNFDR